MYIVSHPFAVYTYRQRVNDNRKFPSHDEPIKVEAEHGG